MSWLQARTVQINIKRLAKLQAAKGKAARKIRAAAITNELQDEDDEKVPERLADDTVVAIVKVPDIVAVLPDAVTLPLNVTLPEPPATS